jgi:DNA polymerase I-like protein with 3'-5' exonuclease and polymerase domains
MQFHRILTEQDARDLANRMPEVVSVDTEYDRKTVRNAVLLSIQVATDDETAYYFDPEFLPILTPALKRSRVIFMQNYVVDRYILEKNRCDLSNTPILDLMLMDHLVDERREHGLQAIVLREYGDDYKTQFWSKYKTFQEADPQDALEYSCKDVIYTLRLGKDWLAKLSDKSILLDQVHRLSWALFDTEIQGVNVNVELMKQTKQDMSKKIEEYLPKLREEFNDYCTLWELQKWKQRISSPKLKTDKGRLQQRKPDFSFSSDKQLSWLLYNGMQLPVLGKTKTGNPATDYETLQKLEEDHPEIGTIVEYKKDKSLYATFVEGMLERVEDGRIYPSLNVNGTSTGRISHSNPNLGNLPKDGPIRSFFIPSAGRSIIGADYSQLEVIVEANLTEDKSLLKIILEGASKHDITAQGLSLPRDVAKTLNFALQYGAGVQKVRKLLNVTNQEAQDIFDRYWELYSGVKALKEKTIKELEDHGQVTNLFGRTRHFDKPLNKWDKLRQERQAYNFMIQGVAGDICNRAYWQYSDCLKTLGYGRTLWPVHDEIVAEVNDDNVDYCKAVLVDVMADVTEFLSFKYPLQAVAYGPVKYWSKL